MAKRKQKIKDKELIDEAAERLAEIIIVQIEAGKEAQREVKK